MSSCKKAGSRSGRRCASSVGPATRPWNFRCIRVWRPGCRQWRACPLNSPGASSAGLRGAWRRGVWCCSPPAWEAHSHGPCSPSTLSSPLLLGMSQWVTIELMNGALGIWALVFFVRCLQASKTKRRDRALSALGLGLTAAASLALKPVVIFALLPAFGFLAVQALRGSRQPLKALAWGVLPSLAAGVVALAWHRHAAHVNDSVQNPFALQSNLSWYSMGASLAATGAPGEVRRADRALRTQTGDARAHRGRARVQTALGPLGRSTALGPSPCWRVRSYSPSSSSTSTSRTITTRCL